MLNATVGTHLLSNRQAVVDMAPVVRRDLCGFEPVCFQPVDQLKSLLDLGRLCQAEQHFGTWPDARDADQDVTPRPRAKHVKPPQYRAVVVGQPADVAENLTRLEKRNGTATIEHVLVPRLAETKPMVDAVGQKMNVDAGQVAGHG